MKKPDLAALLDEAVSYLLNGSHSDRERVRVSGLSCSILNEEVIASC